ncbi:MAG: short chain dehydrogenase [Thiotrichales bacterium]|jgi:NAD(P)-dependent dehydrogenase (short-subunit alcohol dehydrogenase family)|nr:short chain dehydrogenase [Thiotrichales bacterium]MBT3854773.1 short chain dehydrogenase [Thiotrichales bacterium]MBT4653255.1 short chain dehydrogenase [Thiotrichales bacterium]MBT5499310.1 short chain dehydrogenase [Thiotrichales bacterium]MBT5983769.1 short chain dehydrogenase [Thiotrichales bacterium]
MKKIIVVGSTGRLGRVVVSGLEDYEVIRAGRSGPDLKIDALDFESVSNVFASVGSFDGLVSCIGGTPFKTFEELTMEDFATGLSKKCFSQLNLAKAAIPFLTENGSITLTSGIIGDEPILAGSCAAAANGALNMCVSTLAAEYAGKLRINIVSPSIIENSVEDYGMLFDGFEPTSEKRIIEVYRRTISAPISGRVLRQTRSL